jgi:hypothetical protein
MIEKAYPAPEGTMTEVPTPIVKDDQLRQKGTLRLSRNYQRASPIRAPLFRR